MSQDDPAPSLSQNCKGKALKQAASDWLSQISALGLSLQNVQVLVFLPPSSSCLWLRLSFPVNGWGMVISYFSRNCICAMESLSRIGYFESFALSLVLGGQDYTLCKRQDERSTGLLSFQILLPEASSTQGLETWCSYPEKLVNCFYPEPPETCSEILPRMRTRSLSDSKETPFPQILAVRQQPAFLRNL